MVTAGDATACWACKSIEIGSANRFTPWVLALSGVPEVTDRAQAVADPDPAKCEYQSDFARRYVAQGQAQEEARGHAEGEISGRAALVIKQLSRRFGSLTETTKTRITGTSIEELDAIGERLLTAQTLQDALDSH